MHIVRSSQCAVTSEEAISVQGRSQYTCARLEGEEPVHLCKTGGGVAGTPVQDWRGSSRYTCARLEGEEPVHLCKTGGGVAGTPVQDWRGRSW
ncbi:unnamed protein product [Staurois parvus]|uniref:Uncharacterized protein n=1 Tax=Staurois parvus TaxID=386267 RepID=A0ABN9H048_9NEOB|nr:unnamed protein product [Staurois parvus]